MSKTLTINNEVFTVITPRKNKLSLSSIINRLCTHAGRDIYSCYEKPSVVKQSIYNDWLTWKNNTPSVTFFGVSGYNCMTFSLEALHEDSNGEFYLLTITRANNTATYIELK